MNVTDAYPVTDQILAGYQHHIGQDFPGYRNHCTRMLNFCHCLNPQLSAQDSHKLQIAAAFHDIGLWTHDRVDYLDPSIDTCLAYLGEHNLQHWQEEICVIIEMHHKIRPYKGPHQPLAELFRQADLIDFSLGWVKFAVPASFVKQVKQALPNAGFHKTLMRFTLVQLTRNPLKPLPMMRQNPRYKR